jgi:hypothetical protein
MKSKSRASHIFPKQAPQSYVDPQWCAGALFWGEIFAGGAEDVSLIAHIGHVYRPGHIHDPCSGTGNIVKAARRAGYQATGSDLVPRDGSPPVDFLRSQRVYDNLIFNPPHNNGLPEAFARHALECAREKVAFLFPTARLNAATWLSELPRRRLWFLTPRPAMPPIDYTLAGNKPQSRRIDLCWVVLEPGYIGPWETAWLTRDEELNEGYPIGENWEREQLRNHWEIQQQHPDKVIDFQQKAYVRGSK